MTIGGAIILIAAGAILKWAVTAHVSGFDIQTAGTVLFVVGLVGLALALIYTFYWAQQRDRPADTTRAMRGPQGPPPGV
jgi:apolipoprotein N-acyltransferase